MADSGDRKLRSMSAKSPLANPSPSTRKRMEGLLKETLMEESQEMNKYSKFARMGKSLGLEGDALASFITKALRDEEELVLKKESARKEEEAREEDLRLKREAAEREKEELRLKRAAAEREEARREREEEAHEVELRMKRETHEEDLRLKRQAARREEENLRMKQEKMETQHVSLDPLDEGDDVDSYISHFERIATLCHWKEISWSTRLVSLLRGKAREAVLRLHPDDLTDYVKVKTALLRHFRLDAEAYRRRFRSMRKDQEETFEQFFVRMTSCLDLWCQAANKDPRSAEDLRDLLLQEQMYRVLSPDLTFEVRRSCPKTAADAAKEATVVAEAKRMGRDCRREREMGRIEPLPEHGDTTRKVAVANTAREAEPSRSVPKRPLLQQPPRLQDMVQCFRCGRRGHAAPQCREPHAVAFMASEEFPDAASSTSPSLCVSCAKKPYTPRCKVAVNGLPANGVRDTGAGYTVVSSGLVTPDDYTGDTVLITMAESRCQTRLPVAEVDLRSPFLTGRIRVLVMNHPVEEVLIGNFAQRHQGSPLERVPVYATATSVSPVLSRSKTKKPDRPPNSPSLKDQVIAAHHEPLVKAQRTDLSLRGAREASQRGTVFKLGRGEVSYHKEDDILIRKYRSPRGTVTQVCVPRTLRPAVLALAHDVPSSGHLGVTKTKARILPHFYWPGICSDISRYCRTCERCQHTVDKERVSAVPVVEMSPGREPLAEVGTYDNGSGKIMSQQSHRYEIAKRRGMRFLRSFRRWETFRERQSRGWSNV